MSTKLADQMPDSMCTQIGASFHALTGVDLLHLSPDEVRELLELLPAVLLYLHTRYNLAHAYKDSSDER